MTTEDVALTRAELDALEQARWFKECINAGVGTSRRIRRRTMLRLEKLGLVTEIDAVCVDGDGFTIHPERYRPAFLITDVGRVLAQRLYDERIRAFHQADGRACDCPAFCAKTEATP